LPDGEIVAGMNGGPNPPSRRRLDGGIALPNKAVVSTGVSYRKLDSIGARPQVPD